MRLAAHQPNMIPWFPFFEKMSQSDVFVLLGECQFEKGGYQNRAEVFGKWWTKPIQSGLAPINEKFYVSGMGMMALNTVWIYAMKGLLDIETRIELDFPTEKTGTDRLIEICQRYKATEYLTNMDAIDKYLEPAKFEAAGIKIVPFKTMMRKHTFEVIDEIGLEGAIKLLKKGRKDERNGYRTGSGCRNGVHAHGVISGG